MDLVDAAAEGRPASPLVFRAPAAEGGAGHFLRFCGVGSVGFAVDAVALMACIHLLGAGPIAARLTSASVALLTTFELNRRWAFRAARVHGYGRALTRYIGVQALGLACNVAVYSGCSLLLPAPLNDPLLCLVAASAAALSINYAGTSRLVFRPNRG